MGENSYSALHSVQSPVQSSSPTRWVWKVLLLALILGGVAAVSTILLLNKSSDSTNDNFQPTCSMSQLPEVMDNPPAPQPERVDVSEVSLPPTAPSNTSGSCTLSINPHGTGCMSAGDDGVMSGSFLPDNKHIVASIVFVGAPLAPHPASIYSGNQVILLAVDGSTFSNGDSWKCLTCGTPADHLNGTTLALLDYAQTFKDGKRVLVGSNIIDCSPYLLTDDACTPNTTWVYPIHWMVSPDGSGAGGSIRELRIHPNNDYLGFNNYAMTGNAIGEFGYMGRLVFNPRPTRGTPLVPRYELVNVTCFFGPSISVFDVSPLNSSELLFNPLAPVVGEFRGWSKDGTEALWIGQPVESGNFDIMSATLATGQTRRLTRNPEYADPVDMSPDNNWTVVMDTRGSGRMMFAAGMRGIPPLTDLVTSAATGSIRNNGERRFFEAYLIDRYGDRGAYQGQLLTADPRFNDPNWNGRADPRWSHDGTMVVMWQSIVTSPACGGINPLPCPVSTEPGARRTRVLLARFADRQPTPEYPIPPIPNTIPWATPYVPGSPTPVRPPLSTGVYTLRGRVSGSALVSVNQTSDGYFISDVSVRYSNYSDNGYHIIDGWESVSRDFQVGPSTIKLVWYSNLTLSGCESGAKWTDEQGYAVKLDLLNPVLDSSGTLTTRLGNILYTSPNPGT